MKKVTNFLMCILFCICMVSIQGCSFFKKVEAEKEYAVAEGKARSKKAIADANAYALLTEARAQQEANRILSESLTHDLIQYNTIIKWDGKLPSMMTGNAVPMISIPQE